MKFDKQSKNKEAEIWKWNLPSVGIFFLIFLFTYAGLTKLLERDLFYLNLLNTPLIIIEKPWALTLSWFVPLLELFIVLLLIFPKTKLKALYISISLLSVYVLYILALLFIAPFRPCACAGIVDSFSWEQQLWFTLGCLSIAVLTLYLIKRFK